MSCGGDASPFVYDQPVDAERNPNTQDLYRTDWLDNGNSPIRVTTIVPEWLFFSPFWNSVISYIYEQEKTTLLLSLLFSSFFLIVWLHQEVKKKKKRKN